MYCASTRANIIRYDDKEYHHYWQYDKDEKVSICKAKLVVGGACNRDAMCALGACYDGECVMPKKAESRCDSDGDCATMTCGESNYRDGDREKWEACHADGHDCKLNTVCVDKYEDGEKCYRDENCKSGYCSEKSGVCSSR